MSELRGRDTRVVDDVGMVLLRPTTVLLWAPEPVHARDNAPATDVRELGDVGSIRRRDNGVQAAEVHRDSCIQRGDIVRTYSSIENESE